MLLWIILASLIALLPVFLIKKYTKTDNMMYIIFALCSYILLTYFYIKIFRVGELSTYYIILQILQIVLVIIGSMILFNEEINKRKIIGIILGIISIYILLKK